MKTQPLYIETSINCPLDTLWEHTQDPNLHQQWDLRFSSITYLPKATEAQPQQFLYSTQVGFGLKIRGTGESLGTKAKGNEAYTSVLKFWSDSRLSLIRQGSGYWKYKPHSGGISFHTAYNYQTRWGLSGRLLDQYLFRPLMLWATAWSFDSLKIWLEKGLHPRQARRAQLSVWLVTLILALVWMYQGLVPKLLFPHSGELQMLQQSGVFAGYEALLLRLIGGLEILFGCCLLIFQYRMLHFLNIAALCILGFGAALSNPAVLTAPFNPLSFNLALIGLSCISLIHLKDLPKASHCKTHRP